MTGVDPAYPTGVQPIPVTVVTGFLGAGKTTLLNRILLESGSRRYAVIVNEFAELGIDGDLVLEAREEIVTLANGCICCNVRGDLLRALESILTRGVVYDAILIETTGLADPGPVIQTFYMDPDVAARVRLDAVVTVIDACHFCRQIGQAPEIAAQIAAADLILLNKTDLLLSREVESVESEVRALNPFASIRRTVRAALPASEVIGRNAFDLRRVVERVPGFGENRARHTSGIQSISMEVERPIDLDRFLRWIDSVIALQGEDVMRVKGILNVTGEDQPFVFQSVHRIMDGDFLNEATFRQSKLVVIGRNLDQERMRRNFAGCQSKADYLGDLTTDDAPRADLQEQGRARLQSHAH